MVNLQGRLFYTRNDLDGDVEVLLLCPAVVVDLVVTHVATLWLASPPV